MDDGQHTLNLSSYELGNVNSFTNKGSGENKNPTVGVEPKICWASKQLPP